MWVGTWRTRGTVFAVRQIGWRLALGHEETAACAMHHICLGLAMGHKERVACAVHHMSEPPGAH